MTGASDSPRASSNKSGRVLAGGAAIFSLDEGFCFLGLRGECAIGFALSSALWSCTSSVGFVEPEIGFSGGLVGSSIA